MLAAVMLFAGCAGTVAPDLVITNARVFTNDTARPWAEAVAIKGDRVVGVGTSAEVRVSAGPATRIIDAGGRVLIPGFNDARVDLPPGEPTPERLTNIDRVAIRRGATSLQVVAGGPMRTLVAAAQQAQRHARWRIIRSPMDGERPHDEEPYLPPQPGVRLMASGAAYTAADGTLERQPVDILRLPTLAGWAYGAEDPIVMSGEASRWVAALSAKGVPTVWQNKRPRFDLADAAAGVDADTLAAFFRLGVVVTWTPSVHRRRPDIVGRALSVTGHHAGPSIDAGLVVALGSGAEPWPEEPYPVHTILHATLAFLDAGGRELTREEAVRAMTWGSAYAEKAERDKGWIGPGALADLVVLSDNIFTSSSHQLAQIDSVLTLVGGTIVYDSGVLSK